MEKQKKKTEIKELPDYIIENYIFPFLNSRELFFVVRTVSSEWHEMMKNCWGGNIKEEMFSQIKNLTYIYEKDALTKAYEFKLQYLLNYRNLLNIYNLNANVLAVLVGCVQYIQEEEIAKMLSIFFTCFGFDDCLLLLMDRKGEELSQLLNSNEKLEEYKEKINDILEIERIDFDAKDLKNYQIEFSQLNKEYIENLNESCRLIFSFLQGIIEYQLSKLSVQELKEKVESLFIRIQNETQLWPRKKKFFETAYKFLLYSKSSNKYILKMLKIFQRYKIKHPLIDFKEESYKLILGLKAQIEQKKIEILKNTQSENMETNESIDAIFLQNLFDRRLLLSKKLILIEKFYYLYYKATFEGDEETCYIKGKAIPLKTFLVSLVISSRSCGENFDEDVVFQIIGIIENKYQYDIKQLFYTEEDEEKQKEIESLTEQKQHLLLQKKQTEQVLMVLKKYLILKESLAKNKNKYKMILFLLSKIRKGEARQLDENTIEEMLKNIDLEDINFDMENISEAERNELNNFESSDKLLKEIEDSLTKQINSFFVDEEKNEANSDSSDK